MHHDSHSALAGMLIPDEAPEEQKVAAYKAMTATARLAWNPFGHNPTLLIWGDDDRFIPTALADKWARLIKDSRVVKLKDCGHMLMFEGEDGFVQAITNFL